jgi:hypothetical protein
MKSLQARLLLLLTAVVLAAIATWLVQAIEWVDVDARRPPSAEARRDRYYAVKALARRLGATVVSPQSLVALPPSGAVLVLGSAHWNLFPEREAALRAWVEAGGRLVLDSNRGGARMPSWFPLRAVSPSRAASAPGGASAASAAAPAASDAAPDPPDPADAIARMMEAPQPPCRLYAESDSSEPAYGAPRMYRICAFTVDVVRGGRDRRWHVDDGIGPRALRAGFGQGSVTLSAFFGLLRNDSIGREDNALAIVALLGLRRGDEIWFVAEEARPPLLLWLWDSARAAIVLGLVALAFALWRVLPRFGPVRADAPPHRRSTAEQIRRTAGFIAAGDGAALHRAALHALETTAARTLRGFDARAHVAERAAVIAAAAAIDAAELSAAMRPPAARSLAGAIATLERARRRLAVATPSLSPPAGKP